MSSRWTVFELRERIRELEEQLARARRDRDENFMAAARIPRMRKGLEQIEYLSRCPVNKLDPVLGLIHETAVDALAPATAAEQNAEARREGDV